MREVAVEKLVREANASPDPTVIHYRSAADFMAQNRDCCTIHRVAEPELLTWDVELTILYRKQTDGAEPFYQRTVQFGPRLENMEDSGRPLSPELYRLFVTHQHGEVVP